jgi:hypothetical protein
MVFGPTQIRKIFAEIERNAPEEAASAIAKQILGKS